MISIHNIITVLVHDVVVYSIMSIMVSIHNCAMFNHYGCNSC